MFKIFNRLRDLESQMEGIRFFLFGDKGCEGFQVKIINKFNDQSNQMTEVDNALKDFTEVLASHKEKLEVLEKNYTSLYDDTRDFITSVSKVLESYVDETGVEHSKVLEELSLVCSNTVKNQRECNSMLLEFMDVTIDKSGIYHSGIIREIERLQIKCEEMKRTLSKLNKKVFPEKKAVPKAPKGK